MKLRLVLIISVCVNLALAGAFLVSKRSTPAPLPATGEVTATKSTTRGERERRAQPSGGAAQEADSFHWGTVESEDYRQYIANLRAIGCPEETIRDIIIADINKLYAGRLLALYPSPNDFKFWKTDDRENRTEQRDRERKRREIEREKEQLIKELLGVDYETEMAKWEGRPDGDAWRLGFLSAEKQQAVQALQDKFREMERALFGEMREGRGGGDVRAKMLALRAQREAELAQLLSPQEFQEYQLRNSMTARQMRDSLGSFAPSEEEFRKIFEARKNFDEQYGFRGPQDDATREQRRVAQEQLEASLRATLGEDRFREYQLAQDERYRDIYEFTRQQNLPKETAQSIYDIRKAAEEQRQQLLNNSNLPREQRTATLTEVVNATREALAATMSPDAFKQYLNSGEGRWLNPERFASMERGGDRGGFGGFGGFRRENRGGPGPGGGR